MKSIKDVLLLNISEDIKKVIDLEDQTENEIQNEIENYIITPKLSEYFSKFIQTYKSSIKETGVWISGFYGSGKSYFGKSLGHILANKNINGTSARERFILRLRGLRNENLLENEVRGLDSLDSRVIFIDVAKQNTDKGGLSWVLFRNFLSSLGLLNNSIGIIEFSMFLEGTYQEFLDKSKELEGKNWIELKREIQQPITFRRLITKYKYTEKEYDDLKKSADHTIESFDAAKLKEYLGMYLKKYPAERIVFVFDEASEALASKKFTLLELEGISESLSSLSRKVWTIAIAQEKLDDVIHNANVNRSQLVKVTDRFKTQIHLESTEVEYIIKNRLLKKTDKANTELAKFFENKTGQITDLTSLKASFNTVTGSEEEFAQFYPFNKYHFRLLQNFLFKSNILAKTQIAERGMIITTFDVLRNRLKDKPLFHTATSFDIASEGQLHPPIHLSNKYDKAKKRLQEKKSVIDGENLLKVLHFLTESEGEAEANLENIAKCYIEDLNTDFYTTKSGIETALTDLVSVDLVIETNGLYKIASDQEQKLKSEMSSMPVELFIRKRNLIEQLKKLQFIKGLGSIAIEGSAFNFYVQSDIDDEIVSSTGKFMKIKAFSLYSIESNYDKFIENQKQQSVIDKNTIYLIPSSSYYEEINGLFEEVYRYEEIEKRYQNDNDGNLRQIVRNFSKIKDSKVSRLIQLISSAYQNATILYRGEEKKADPDTFKSLLSDLQKRLVNSVYTKRLPTQLSEALAKNVLKETNPTHLHSYFSGTDFSFFDNNGNFIGDHLKVVEEIVNKIKTSFTDGKSLENSLNEPPCGYQFGTINSTLAVLIRAGRLVVRYNSRDIYDYKDGDALKVFSSSREFQKASFKSISKTLTTAQKNKLVQGLLDIKIKDIIEKTIGYNTNDFEIVEALTTASDILLDRTKSIQNIGNADILFPELGQLTPLFKAFTSKTTEVNYIEKAESFISEYENYKKGVKTLSEIDSFKQTKLPHADRMNEFSQRMADELAKIEDGNSKSAILPLITSLQKVYNEALRTKYSELESLAQSIKDQYYTALEVEHKKMAASHCDLKNQAELLINKIKSAPESLNADLMSEVNAILVYAEKRNCQQLELEYDTSCCNCKFTLYETISINEAITQRFARLLDIESRIITSLPPEEKHKPKTLKKHVFTLSSGVVRVGEYRERLTAELESIESLSANDEIDLTVNTEKK